MQIITIHQPVIRQGKDGKNHFVIIVDESDHRTKHTSDVEKTYEQMKTSVVNDYLKQGFKAPQNEIAKYITQNGYEKRVKTGVATTYRYATGDEPNGYENLYDTEFVPGSSLVMAK